MKQEFVATIPGVLMLLGAMFHSTAVDAQSSPSAYTKSYRYDAAGRQTGAIAPDPDGAGPLHYLAVRYTYDSVGNLTAVETGSLSTWKSEAVAPANWGAEFKADTILNTTYDALGRKTIERAQGVDATGSMLLMAVTQYGYDAQGRLECTAIRMNPAAFAIPPSSACALGPEGSFGPDRIIRKVYDGAGQLRTVQKAYGTPLQQDYATYTYTPNGRVETATDAKGNKTQYTYDGHGRVKRWQFPHKANIGSIDEADFEEYGYDENANRTSLRKRDDRTITVSYDALNRVRVKTVPASASGAPGYTAYNDYDLRGLQLYARFGSDSGQGITNTYDGAGRLRLSRSNLGGVTRDVASDYDADGNRTRVTYPDGNYFDYAYDGLDRFLQLSQNGPSTTLALLSYDAQGRRDKLARDAQGTVTQYGYDPISRLSALTHDLDGTGTVNDLTMGYVYNPASQMVTRSLTNNVYEFPVSSSNLMYAVNGLNQYTQISGDAPAALGWDANGNLTSDGATSFTYDSENRLRSASGAKNATLTYDPLGRLYEVATASTTTRFVYDGDRLIAEYDASGTLLRTYVHGSGVDEPVVWYEGSQVSAANRRYLHANYQGSIVAVTGASGNTLQVNRYDPYGTAAAGNTGRFQYTGQAAIPELGLLYYKARFYNAGLGRFMQTDPVGYEDDINLYSYVGNDPIGKIDPTGQWELMTFAKTDPNYHAWNTIHWDGGMVSGGHANNYFQSDRREGTDVPHSFMDPGSLYTEMQKVAGEGMVGKPIILLGCNLGQRDPGRPTIFAQDVAKMNNSIVVAADGFTWLKSSGGESFNSNRDVLYFNLTQGEKEDSAPGSFVAYDASGAVVGRYSTLIVDQKKGTFTFVGAGDPSSQTVSPNLVCDQTGCHQ